MRPALPHPRPAPTGINALQRADVDLRGPSRLVAAQGRQPLADLSRARRAAAGAMPATWASPMSNSCRSASIRSTAPGAISRPGCIAPTSRFGTPGGFRRTGRRLPPRRARRAARLGARAFPRRSARPRPFRRHRALRARQPAAGPPSRLGHADLQLRPHRSGQLPGLQRAVLARALRHRRPARRCGRLHALSRLQPAGGRLDSEQAWRPRKSRGHRLPAPLQHRGVRALSAGDHRGGGIRPPGRRCRGRSNMAGSASATNGTWAGCTTR